MKTLKERMVGKVLVRLAETKTGYAGLARNETHERRFEGQDKDRLWELLQKEAAKLTPDFVGYDGAKARFLRIFPGGFGSQKYLGNKEFGERNYKLRAKDRLDKVLPLEQASEVVGAGEAITGIFQATNLLSPFEKLRVRDALRGPNSDAFVHGAADFALGDRERGLATMAHALKPNDAAKWTTVTYLPFLWRPEAHMFLKPTVTRKFAARVGHRFENAYSAALDPSVYESLLDLVSETKAEIKGLQPRDNIDIQSFIWVVGEYSFEDEQR
jgi:hypothetical protein